MSFYWIKRGHLQENVPTIGLVSSINILFVLYQAHIAVPFLCLFSQLRSSATGSP